MAESPQSIRARRHVSASERFAASTLLIEVKGIGAATGSIFLSPNEKRIAEDRRDLYWLYIVTHCDTTAKLEEPIKDPARFPWHEVKKVEHYKLEVNALTEPMQLKEDPPPYGERSKAEG